MRMFLQSVEEIEASLEHQAQDKSGGRSRHDSGSCGDDFLSGGISGNGNGNNGGNRETSTSSTPRAATAKSVFFDDDYNDSDIDGDDTNSINNGSSSSSSSNDSARGSLLDARSALSQAVLPAVRGGETAAAAGRNRHSLLRLRGRAVFPPFSFPLSEPAGALDDGGVIDYHCWGDCSAAQTTIRSLRGGGGGISGGVTPAGTLLSRDSSLGSRVNAPAPESLRESRESRVDRGRNQRKAQQYAGNGARDERRTVPVSVLGRRFGSGRGAGGGGIAAIPAVVLLHRNTSSRPVGAGVGGTAWPKAPSGAVLSKDRARAAATKRSAADKKNGGGEGRGGRITAIPLSKRTGKASGRTTKGGEDDVTPIKREEKKWRSTTESGGNHVTPSIEAGDKTRKASKAGGDDAGVVSVSGVWQRLTNSEATRRRSRSSAAVQQPMPGGGENTGFLGKRTRLALVSLRKRDGGRVGATVIGTAGHARGKRRGRLEVGKSALGTDVPGSSERQQYLEAVSALTSRALKREADARRKRTDWTRRKKASGDGAAEVEDIDKDLVAASATCDEVGERVRDCSDDRQEESGGGVKVRLVTAAMSACGVGKTAVTAAATGAAASAKTCASCLTGTLSSPTRLACAVVGSGTLVVPAATEGDEDGAETKQVTTRNDGMEGTAAQHNVRPPDLTAVVVAGDVGSGHDIDAAATAAPEVVAAQTLRDAPTATEDTNDECEATALVVSGEEGGTPANRLHIGVGGLTQTCAHVCGSLTGMASALCRGSATTVCNVGGGTVRGVFKMAQCCVAFVGLVLSSPMTLVRADGRAITSAGAPGGSGAEGRAAAGAKRWCGHICRSVGTGVSTGCGVVTAAVCLVGFTAVKSVEASARFCRGALRAVLFPTTRLARAMVLCTDKSISILGEKAGTFIVHPCARFGRSGRAAVSSGCLTGIVATCMLREAAVCSAVRSARCCVRSVGCILSSPVKLGRTISFRLRSRKNANAAVVSTAGPEVAIGTSLTTTESSAANIAEVAVDTPPHLMETPAGSINKEKISLDMETYTAIAPYAEATTRTTTCISNNHSRVVAGAVGSSAGNTDSQTPTAWRGGRRRSLGPRVKRRLYGRFRSGARLVSSDTADGSPGNGSALGTENNQTENEQVLPSSSSSSFAFPVFPSLWSRLSKEASLGFFRRSPANETRSIVDEDDATAAAPVPSPGTDSSSSRRALESEAALARWVTTAPSPGVPEHSGRRSRALVCGAAKVATIAVPNSASASASGGGARAAGITRAVRAMAAGEAAEAGAARPAPWKRVRAAAGFAVAAPVAQQTAR